MWAQEDDHKCEQRQRVHILLLSVPAVVVHAGLTYCVSCVSVNESNPYHANSSSKTVASQRRFFFFHLLFRLSVTQALEKINRSARNSVSFPLSPHYTYITWYVAVIRADQLHRFFLLSSFTSIQNKFLITRNIYFNHICSVVCTMNLFFFLIGKETAQRH